MLGCGTPLRQVKPTVTSVTRACRVSPTELPGPRLIRVAVKPGAGLYPVSVAVLPTQVAVTVPPTVLTVRVTALGTGLAGRVPPRVGAGWGFGAGCVAGPPGAEPPAGAPPPVSPPAAAPPAAAPPATAAAAPPPGTAGPLPAPPGLVELPVAVADPLPAPEEAGPSAPGRVPPCAPPWLLPAAQKPASRRITSRPSAGTSTAAARRRRGAR